MTLTNRLSLFLLGTLAVVLAGFSVLLYGLAHFQLFKQVDDRAATILDGLAIAIEMKPDGLEWESSERRMVFSESDEAGPSVWGVFDGQARLIDGAPEAQTFFGSRIRQGEESSSTSVSFVHNNLRWRLARRTYSSDADQDIQLADDEVTAASLDPDRRFRKLELAVAIPLEPVYTSLQMLAAGLTGLSIAICFSVAVAGRWLCRRALAPVTSMAHAARSISTADLNQRLPNQQTEDEIEDLGRAFNDLLRRFQESYERQRRFSSEASHQLRTPLTIMLGQVGVALRRERSTEEYARVLISVKKQSLQLKQIVETLLFLARADSEAVPPETELIELNAWVEDHLRAHSSDSRREDIYFESGDPAPFQVAVHPVLLGQAVDNLLDNAEKYSHPRSPINLRTRREGGEICLAIEDQGCGIAPDDQPHVFEPFFRSTEVRSGQIEGMGLGLAIAQRIVRALGGKIDLQSKVDCGTCFTIRLPDAGQADAPASATDAPTISST